MNYEDEKNSPMTWTAKGSTKEKNNNLIVLQHMSTTTSSFLFIELNKSNKNTSFLYFHKQQSYNSSYPLCYIHSLITPITVNKS